MTNNDELAIKLKAEADKATVLNLDTAQIERGNDGYYECPVCCGEGEVEAKTDFCNIDGVALGVQFYGVGEHHGAAEEYFRAVSPANILALLAERGADKEEIEKLRVSNRILASDAMCKQERIAELEARTVSVNWPAPKDSAQGWKVDPEFISKVQDAIGYDEECQCWEGTPSMEMVEAVLIAAAGIKLEVGE